MMHEAILFDTSETFEQYKNKAILYLKAYVV